MCDLHRRTMVLGGLASITGGGLCPSTAFGQPSPLPSLHHEFVAQAERMRREAVASGDQSFGAVVVLAADIVGWGPSRVVTSRDPNAHAERVAIWDAQTKLATKDLGGAMLYSTSRPCRICEAAAASARIARMYWGPGGRDAGRPLI